MICISKKIIKQSFLLLIIIFTILNLASLINKYSKLTKAATNQEITVAALKIQVNLYHYYDTKTKKIVDKDQEIVNDSINLTKLVLDKERPDIIVFPEYTFKFNVKDKYGNYLKSKRLFLESKQGIYTLYSHNDPLYVGLIKTMSNFARTYNTHILLGTFPLDEDGIIPNNIPLKEKIDMYNDASQIMKSDGALLHIDNTGKIVGLKIKNAVPKGSFVFSIGGKRINVLPIICGDRDNSTSDYIIPDWMKQYNKAPYNIIAISNADDPGMMSEALAWKIQKINKQNSYSSRTLEELRDDFFLELYKKFYPYVTNDYLFIIADDAGSSAILNKTLTPFTKYIETNNYTVVRTNIPNQY